MNLPALTMVIFVSMVKDAYEDYKRQQNDKIENCTECKILCEKKFGCTSVKWKDVRCGNIIRVDEDQIVPADIVLLHSSGQNGQCFVETKSLDGETNLKIKSVSRDLVTYFNE